MYKHTYTHTCIYGVYMVLRMATQPGRTLSLPRAHTHTITRSSHRSPCTHAAIHTYTQRAHGQAAQSSPGYQYQAGVGPVHRGTKPRAINLFARQPATRHCVYPHVNHYVRPRNIEPAPRRATRCEFPAPSFPVVARRNAPWKREKIIFSECESLRYSDRNLREQVATFG